LTFQLLLISAVLITICTAELHPISAPCFISLIKSLNLFNIWLSHPVHSNYCA
jgi:hypothetical protein